MGVQAQHHTSMSDFQPDIPNMPAWFSTTSHEFFRRSRSCFLHVFPRVMPLLHSLKLTRKDPLMDTDGESRSITKLHMNSPQEDFLCGAMA